jgi:hypothetical protein
MSAVVDTVAALTCEVMTYRNPDGETVTIAALVDVKGRMMPTVANLFVTVPQSNGGRWQSARHEIRTITIPVAGPGPILERDELRRWAAVLDPVKGPGTLAVTSGPSAGRQITCVYDAGLDTMGEQYAALSEPVLIFRAGDPYWEDATERSSTATINSKAFPWFPFLPLVLGSSDVFAQLTIVNDGDVDAWPVVTITGPGTDLTVTNKTTGLAWTLSGAIGSTSTAIVDTRPGHKTARVDGFNAFGRLTDTSVLWPLVPGPNSVSIGFASGTAASKVVFAWRDRWLAA